jgi:hypothetical protein
MLHYLCLILLLPDMTHRTEIIMSNLLPSSLLDELNINGEEIVIINENALENNFSHFSGSCSSLDSSIILNSGRDSFQSHKFQISRKNSLFSLIPSKI